MKTAHKVAQAIKDTQGLQHTYIYFLAVSSPPPPSGNPVAFDENILMSPMFIADSLQNAGKTGTRSVLLRQFLKCCLDLFAGESN
jgi:hypothetical protein